jgi:hypothetical protein
MVSPAGSGSGSGGTGSLGSPLSPTQRDIEATAWTEVNKAALGIVHDAIDQSFTQMNQRYSFSHLGTHTGYQARGGQPLLDHTLENVRLLQSPNVLTDESWNSTYQELVNQLPPGILARYQQEEQKPLNEQDPYFTVTANVLTNCAKILTRITMNSQPPASDSLEAARTEMNLIVSLMAMKQSFSNASQVANKADEYLNEQGANLLHYDEYKNAVKQIKGHAQNLENMDLKTLVNPKAEGG